MFSDESATPESPDHHDLLRRIAGWLVGVAQANPHAVRHDGPCGQRFFCDREEHRADGYRRVEQLRNGYLLFHCEGVILRPDNPRHAERLAGLQA